MHALMDGTSQVGRFFGEGRPALRTHTPVRDRTSAPSPGAYLGLIWRFPRSSICRRGAWRSLDRRTPALSLAGLSPRIGRRSSGMLAGTPQLGPPSWHAVSRSPMQASRREPCKPTLHASSALPVEHPVWINLALETSRESFPRRCGHLKAVVPGETAPGGGASDLALRRCYGEPFVPADARSKSSSKSRSRIPSSLRSTGQPLRKAR